MRNADTPDFLAGGGPIGERMRGHDWAATPLGPAHAWPQSLKTSVSILLNSAFPMFLAWGREHAFIYNDAYAPILGDKHPQALGRPFAEIWAEIWDDIWPLVRSALAGQPTYSENLQLFMRRSGYVEEVYFTFSYSPIREESDRIGGMFCACTETTEQVIGERRLRTLSDLAATSAARASSVEEVEASCLRVLAENRADIPFAALLEVQPGAPAKLIGTAALTPASVEFAEARSWSGAPLAQAARGETMLIRDLPAFLGEVPASFWGDEVEAALALPITRPDLGSVGAVLVLGVNPRRLFDRAYREFFDRAASAIATAMANARAFELERDRADALAELDRAKTTFFSNVSHEFRTPLTLMLGPLQQFLQKHTAVADRSLIELSQRNAMRLLRLVNALLDFSRVEAGRMLPRFEPLDLCSVTAALVSSFQHACEKARLELAFDCDGLREPVFADVEMWEKIVLNLLSNAFKFTIRGGITVRLRELPDSSSIELQVIDTGVGIPAQELPHLFQRFYRVQGQGGRTQEGTGIGLALVQELVRLHEGVVGVESIEGRGSTFTVSIPGRLHEHLPKQDLGKGRSGALTGPTAQAFAQEALRWLSADPNATGLRPELDIALAPPQGARARLVVADDNADMREYLRRLLSPAYDVVTAADGEAALDEVRGARPDLLLTDVMMPMLDGFGLLRAIRSDPDLQDLPVIMLSARAGETASLEGRAAGADDYLVKPFLARELSARIDAALRMARLRRESTQALRESEERFRNIADSAPVMIWTTDATGSCTYLNRRWYEFTGQMPAQAEGSGWLEATHPEDKAEAERLFLRANAVHEAFSVEYRLHRADGEFRWAIDTALPRFGADGAFLGYVGSVIDITERKEMEELQTRLREKLETEVEQRTRERDHASEALRQSQKMEAIGQLTGGVAHDFNNLLTIVIGNVDTIERCLRKLESQPGLDRLRRASEHALAGAQRAAALTQQLLAFSRRQPLEPRPLDANKLVQSMSEILSRTLGERIEVQTVLAGGLWAIEADRNQLESALLNLTVNARDAMPEGGRLTVETANIHLNEAQASNLGEATPGQYVAICVSDTGVGMSGDVLARVFEPFFTTKPVGHGTGLGLSQVYGFVKQSGGHVNIDSEADGGTKVALYLPRLLRPPAEDAAAERITAPNSRRNETVLVVEDEGGVRAYTAEILRELGYRVIEAADAAGAFHLLDRHPDIRLLFTDVGLPSINGRELAEEARRRRPELKVLFTTGYAQDAIVHRGRLDADVDLIGKPFTYATLASKVRQILDC